MKKIISLLLTACMLLSVAVMGVSAENFEIMTAKDDDFFKVLLIGNSMSDDASDCGYSETSTLYNILKSMVGEDTKVCVGLIWSGGKNLAWHATVAEYGMTAGQHYTFAYIEDGTQWSYISGIDTTAQALDYTDWDAVVLQPYGNEIKKGRSAYSNGEHGDFVNLEDSVPYMLDHVATYAPTADIYLYQQWADAYAEGSNTVFDVERDTYDKICKYIRLAEEYVGTKTGATFKDTIPVGAAVQAARGTYLAKLDFNRDAQDISLSTDPQFGLQRDGVHMSLSIGRYIAGLTFAEVLIPESERVEGYTLPSMRPSALVGEMPAEYHEIARLAVDAALASAKRTGKNKYNVNLVTGYENDPVTRAAETLSGISLSFKDITTEEELVLAVKNEIASALGEGFKVDVTLPDGFTVPDGSATQSVTAAISYGYNAGEYTLSAEITNEHVHNYTSAVTAPTCTAQGYTTYTCACGDSYVADYVDATGHSFSDWEEVESVTCTDDGSDKRVCACGEEETRVIEALGHDLGEWVVDIEPTATTLGEKSQYCTRCGERFNVTTIPVTEDCLSKFTDLTHDWYKPYVSYVVANGYMSGTGDGSTFAPMVNMTRSMVVKVLHNIEGSPVLDVENPFSDIKPDWYYDAVIWASEMGIVAGRGDGTFDPNAPVSRQELAAFLYRYASLKGYDVTVAEGFELDFTDASSTGSWATTAVKWAVANGLISGKSANGVITLAPTATATRAEVAVVLAKFGSKYM